MEGNIEDGLLKIDWLILVFLLIFEKSVGLKTLKAKFIWKHVD